MFLCVECTLPNFQFDALQSISGSLFLYHVSYLANTRNNSALALFPNLVTIQGDLIINKIKNLVFPKLEVFLLIVSPYE